MTPVQSLASFSAAAALVTLAPGLDTALVLRASAVEGRRAGVLAALGVGAGCLTWGAAVALGLTAVLAASALAFRLLRLAGAAYLAWLGVKLLIAPRSQVALDGPAARGSPFRRGLLTNLLNPKAAVFYVSFLPQFVPTGADAAAWCFGLAGLHVAMGVAWLSLVAGGVDRARRALARPALVRWLDRITGGVFLAFGARLAAEARG